MNDEPHHKHRKYWLLCLFAVFIAILGVSLPEIEPTPLTYLNASDIITVGATAVGSLQNITEINHGYYNVTEINAQPYYVIVNFTNITNFSFLEAKAKYFSTSGTPSTHIVDIEIFCHTDMDYEDVFFLENSAEWRYFTRHFPDSSHFIMNGNVSIKFNHTSNGNVNHELLIDVVRLIILPQYAKNEVTLNQFFNTTTIGGGGVSFDGNPVNLNGSNMFNGTISNYTTLAYLNTSLNNKVNKTGDNMTGRFNLTLINQTYVTFNDGKGFMNYYEEDNSSILRSSMLQSGVQWWRMRTTNASAGDNASIGNVGYIFYSTPAGKPGINFFNNSIGHRMTISMSSTEDSLFLASSIAGGQPTAGVYIYPNGTIKSDGLALSGSGNYSILVADSTGKIIAVPMNGSGNHYICANGAGLPFPGTPGC